MKRLLPGLLLLICAAAWVQSAAQSSTTGPTQAWNVFTLPNEKVTPNWKSNKAYIPRKCRNKPDACADDNRFWELWNFNNFSGGIANSFGAVASQGQYQSVMMLMPLGDVTDPSNYFAGNIQLMYSTAKTNGAGIGIEVVLFPKWKYGAEWCYLYPSNAPSNSCPTVGANGEALAHQKLLQLMDYVQGLGGVCSTPGTFHSWFAIWYGWTQSEFPYQGNQGQVLKAFWNSLPTSGANSHCNLQASYISWLDSGWGPTGDQYVDSPDVHSLQTYVGAQSGKQLYVDTELYSQSQIQKYANAFANQTVITGFWNASTINDWARGMCTKWNSASHPDRLGVWTFYDRDVGSSQEYYRSYINDTMAAVGSICTY
jgi:hypothetical protein